MVTGKNKEQFEEWYNRFDENYIDFKSLQFELQIGVYLAYYDSKGLTITLSYNYVFDWYFKIHLDKVYIPIQSNFNTRAEAYKEAFKQADKLNNQ